MFSKTFIQSCILLTLLIIATTSKAQSPGGVSNNLSSWYKADNNASLNISESRLQSWSSSKTGGPLLSAPTSAQRPAIASGSSNPSLFSFMPRIRFSSTSNTVILNNALPTDIIGNNGVIFYVGSRKPNSASVFTYRKDYLFNTPRYQLKPSFRIQTSDGIKGYTFDVTAPTQQPNTAASIFTNMGSAANQKINVNSILYSNCTNCNNATYNPSISQGFYIGANFNSEYSSDDIAEIITYSNALSSSDIDKIESYLAIKYGITRGDNSSTINYFSSNATEIWTSANNTGFNKDITGIGRDDNSGLNKKQSISVNYNEVVAIGLQTLALDNNSNTNSFSTNHSFLLWGSNGMAALTNPNNSSCFNNLPDGIQAKMEREWKTQTTNFSQNVTVGFLESGLENYLPISNLRLLVDDDGNYSNATIYSGAVINGSFIVFNNVDLSASSRYFTLATTDYLSTSLPIELLSFDVADYNNYVKVSWATAHELNNDYFTIEKSTDTVNWNNLATIPGYGNSNTIKYYDFNDYSPFEGVSYYRLKQTDRDGSYTYHGIKSVHYGANNIDVKIYPNPANNELWIAATNLDYNEPSFYNLLGENINPQITYLAKSSNKLQLNVAALNPGIYIIKIKESKMLFIKE